WAEPRRVRAGPCRESRAPAAGRAWAGAPPAPGRAGAGPRRLYSDPSGWPLSGFPIPSDIPAKEICRPSVQTVPGYNGGYYDEDGTIRRYRDLESPAARHETRRIGKAADLAVAGSFDGPFGMIAAMIM